MGGHDGFMPLAKPAGLSSAAAVGKAKRLLGLDRKTRIGHTGTLDPLAEGLLVLAIGPASRFIRFLVPDKEYEVQVAFGRATDSYDAEGAVTAEAPAPADLAARIEAALPRFRGEFEQAAPAHSALKHQGRPLYRYARAGEQAPVKKRLVRISRLETLRLEGARLTLAAACSAGTYMRSLAHDLGEACGCPAHMAGLRRTVCNGLRLEQAADFEALAEAQPLPVAEMLAHLPRADLNADEAAALRHGRGVESPGIAGFVRLLAPGAEFIGVGEERDGELRPAKLLPEPEAG
ncbi:MAG: tRNA pseudouridine(55) synthase TruB [Betaproteobacteria bacterium AqS2]|uniref:tRNA pseudouridine synthase B n=1 Tax=Candidatus Amphirhobacter heronislandensis TaxID=1732024 RepID=A0A930Y248_9GAMM|nr:tRNA pseudouridine(55) synthase TruB [Betaproteobacteria bacterium AqS2]